MAETDREQVISLLRACVLSMKGGVPVKNLNRKLYVHHQSPFLYISRKIWAFTFLLSCIEYGQELLEQWISHCSVHVLVLVQQFAPGLLGIHTQVFVRLYWHFMSVGFKKCKLIVVCLSFFLEKVSGFRMLKQVVYILLVTAIL